MRIRWLGHAAFLLTGESSRVAIDPYGRFPADRPMKFDYPPLEGVGADLVLISHEHLDHNAVEVIVGEPEVIRSRAGAFESPIGEVTGIASEHDPQAGTRRGANTIFRFTLDGVTCCHLGDFGQRELRAEQQEAIGEVDVLFLPVGGGPTIGGGQAAEIVAQIAPSVAVPMHYATPAVDFLEGPDDFLAAVAGRVERLDSSEVEAGEHVGAGDGTVILMLEQPV